MTVTSKPCVEGAALTPEEAVVLALSLEPG